jgi:hypothetical protein
VSAYTSAEFKALVLAAVDEDVDAMATWLDERVETPTQMVELLFTIAGTVAAFVRASAPHTSTQDWSLEFSAGLEDTSPVACAGRLVTAGLNDDGETQFALALAAADRSSPEYAMEVVAVLLRMLGLAPEIAEEASRV